MNILQAHTARAESRPVRTLRGKTAIVTDVWGSEDRAFAYIAGEDVVGLYDISTLTLAD